MEIRDAANRTRRPRRSVLSLLPRVALIRTKRLRSPSGVTLANVANQLKTLSVHRDDYRIRGNVRPTGVAFIGEAGWLLAPLHPRKRVSEDRAFLSIEFRSAGTRGDAATRLP